MSAFKNTLAYAIQENVFAKPLVVKFVNLFTTTTSEVDYKLAVEALTASVFLCDEFFKELNLKSRILATLADGTVWYDSARGNRNTYANFKTKTINENHESRYSIRQAMDSYEGVGWESKYSTSDGNYEDYYAVRGGVAPQEIKYVIRLSIV